MTPADFIAKWRHVAFKERTASQSHCNDLCGLLGLPDMTPELAQKIVGAQLRGSGGEPLPDVDNKRSNTSWLFSEGIVDLPTLRTLDQYLTGRGDVFRLQVMGHFDGGGPVARIEAVIDATQNPPQAIFFRDLTDLGRGYALPVMTR